MGSQSEIKEEVPPPHPRQWQGNNMAFNNNSLSQENDNANFTSGVSDDVNKIPSVWKTNTQFSGGPYLLLIFFVPICLFFAFLSSAMDDFESSFFGYLFIGLPVFFIILFSGLIIWGIILDFSRKGFLLVNITFQISDVKQKVEEILHSASYSFTKRSETGRLPVFPMRYSEVFSLSGSGLNIRLKNIKASTTFGPLEPRTVIEIGPIKKVNEIQAREIRRILNETFQIKEPQL